MDILNLKTESFGNELVLSCGTHTKNDLAVTQPDQFDLRPHGGCQLACEFRLPRCGHTCMLKCHTFDREHKEYICTKKCDKQIARCGHLCKQKCSHDGSCRSCDIQVDKQIPVCGHPIKMRCDLEPKRDQCTFPCQKSLPCGHNCTQTCGKCILNCGPCQFIIEIPLACRHGGTVKVKCSANEQEIWMAKNSCRKQCGGELECNHKCMKSCFECFGGLIHGECSEKCSRYLFCGHKCQVNN